MPIITGLLVGLFLGGHYGAVTGFIGTIIGSFFGLYFYKIRHKDLDFLQKQIRELKEQLTALSIKYQSKGEETVFGTTPLEQNPLGKTSVESTQVESTPVMSVPSAMEPSEMDSFTTEPSVTEPFQNQSPHHPADFGLFRFFVDFFTKGNVLVRIGMILLFVGVTFLFKLAAQFGYFPIPVRFALTALGAIALIAWGFFLRQKRPDISLVAQGGGISIFYLTLFTATLPRFNLLTPTMAFVMMVAVVFLSGVLAVGQNAMVLAVLGITGGFLAPVLISTGEDRHVALFTYYAILNAGILGIAFYRSWRPLNLLGFIFTFGIGALWGFKFYKPEFFASVEPFLILFFLFYVACSVLFAIKQPLKYLGAVDGTLVFATPIVFLALQHGLVKNIEKGMAFTSLALALFYLVLALILIKRVPNLLTLMFESFLSLGTIFVTLTLPLALNAQWTSTGWALEGAGLIWIGLRQNRKLARYFGTFLIFVSGFIIKDTFQALVSYHWADDTTVILNSVTMGSLILCLSAFTGAFIYQKHSPHQHKLAAGTLFFWGLFWWYLTLITEVESRLSHQYVMPVLMVFLTISQFIIELIRRRIQWNIMAVPGKLLLPFLAFLFFDDMPNPGMHPLEGLYLLAWPLGLGAVGWIFYSLEKDQISTKRHHPPLLWVVLGLLSWEVTYQFRQFIPENSNWAVACWGLVPALFSLILLSPRAQKKWPLQNLKKSYLVFGFGLVAFYLFIFFYIQMFWDGNALPLITFPVFNPLDLSIVVILTFWWAHHYRLLQEGFVTRQSLGARIFPLFYFFQLLVALTLFLLRALHHHSGIAYDIDALYDSIVVQTSLSFFWTILALGGMILATRKSNRPLWMGGMTLLLLEVLKLITVDMKNTGTVARTISFMGVGLLVMVIGGYFAPLPPKQKTTNV